MSERDFDVSAARDILRERDIHGDEAEQLLAQPTLTISEIARIRGVKEARYARQTLQNWGVQPLGRRPGPGGESFFDTTAAWKAILEHPGKAWRKGRAGRLGREGGRRPAASRAQTREKVLEIYRSSPRELGLAFDSWTIEKLTTYLNDTGVTDLQWGAVQRILAAAEDPAPELTSN